MICPICRGASCIPYDRGSKIHQTRPCPKSCGCNGSGEISEHKYKWLLNNMIDGEIKCLECGGKHKVHLKEIK